jgi:hypothetical protein
VVIIWCGLWCGQEAWKWIFHYIPLLCANPIILRVERVILP